MNIAYTRPARNGRVASRPLPVWFTETLAALFFVVGILSLLALRAL